MIIKRLVVPALSIAGLVAGALVHAETPATGWYVAPELLMVSPDSKLNARGTSGGRLAVGKSLSELWDGEISVGQTKHLPTERVTSGKFDLGNIDLTLRRVFDRDQRISPFVDVGLGVVRSKYVNAERNVSLAGKAGFGAMVALGNVATSRVRLIADVGAHLDRVKDRGTAFDPYVGLGLRFSFGAAAAAAPVAAAPAVVAAPAPVAAPVAPPAPVVRDADGDGVPDAADRCPNTAAGAKVDANGCELDSDRDGVVDRLDRCPNTPAGDKVDAAGCSLSITLRVAFDTDSATITAGSLPELDRFVTFLRDVPSAQGELQGHTDSKGSSAHNLSLSQRRADAVRTYVIDKGISAARLTAKGYGPNQPIADNNTVEGRAQNRRVVFERSAAR